MTLVCFGMRHVYGVRRGKIRTMRGVNSPHMRTRSPKRGSRDRSWRTRVRRRMSERVGKVDVDVDAVREEVKGEEEGGTEGDCESRRRFTKMARSPLL